MNKLNGKVAIVTGASRGIGAGIANEQIAALAAVSIKHQRAEERVRQQEREFRQIVEAIPQLIFVLAPDGSYLYANSLVLEYTGVTLDDVQAGTFATDSSTLTT